MDQIKHSARACLAIVLIALLAAAAFADTLRLKDGSIIKGRIVSFGAGKFVVLVGEGSRERQMTFSADEVESIQFDAVATRTEPVSNDAQYVETSTPSTNSHRVIKTDTVSVQPTPRPTPAATRPQATEPSRSGIAKPIELSVKVLADNSANGWTNSGWVVRKGQKIRVIGGGSISLGKGKSTGPSGLYDLDDPAKLLKSVPTGALIAVIGDDNNEFIYIGSERTFTASRDGALFLGVNEGDLTDNSGTYDVRIEIEPA
ncbi:MAG: hypothetical protein IT173_05140 [Acidobacteria bacterium]|nr:hypothetical protein [Acidobacteriota bacterium]